MAKELYELLSDKERDDYIKGYSLLSFWGVTQNFDLVIIPTE